MLRVFENRPKKDEDEGDILNEYNVRIYSTVGIDAFNRVIRVRTLVTCCRWEPWCSGTTTLPG